jgi:superfamily I DNA/RNA helicase
MITDYNLASVPKLCYSTETTTGTAFMNIAATPIRRSWSAKLALAAEPKWSHYQQAIFDWVLNGSGNLRVGAVAGSGKSTCLAAIVARLPSSSKAQILAFNKHIVESLKQGSHSNGCPKVPTRVTVSTAHSMGCALVNRTFANPADVDGYKYNKLAKAAIVAKFGLLNRFATRRAKALRKDQIAFLVAMIRGVQSTLCTPSEVRLKELVGYFNIDVPSEPSWPNSGVIADILDDYINDGRKSIFPQKIESSIFCAKDEGWDVFDEIIKTALLHVKEKCEQKDRNKVVELLREYFDAGYPPNPNPAIIAMVEGCIDKGVAMARDEQVIDFGDMLYLPHVWGLQPVAKDWVLVDEVQDANNAQLSLYGKLAANGRAIFVGDADQAIQGFAFASPAMWGKIESKFNTTDLPLSVCYRCPVSHLDLARYFVPQIEAAPGAIRGEIETVHPDAVVEQVQSGDLILCRFTAPLLGLCIKLIIKGIPAKVRGKDLGKQLVAVADIGEECWDNYGGNFADSMAAKIAEAEAEDKQEQVDRLTDHRDAILAIYRAFGQDCRSLSEFLIGIEELFSDESSPVTLSTIHRAKGDEADRVWILAANMMPYAREGMVDWQLKQEENLAYVALTRAKKAMFFVPTEERNRSIDQLMQLPYAGFAVSPVPANAEVMPDIAPYPVGSMFAWFGNPGYEITAVELHEGRWRYKAKYVGAEYHWACDWYDHHLLENVKVLEDC